MDYEDFLKLEEHDPLAASKVDPTTCAGQCRHPASEHVVFIREAEDMWSWACCVMDCPCMNFEPWTNETPK